MSEIEEAEKWNAEYEDELDPATLSSLVVFSRDWTVETVFSQIQQGNIDLDPDFQRRNAWNDLKRSKLIESLTTNLPVPEIVLAEDKDKKGAFIVIDGKQRLLAISGFLDPQKYKHWDSPKLAKLNLRSDLTGKSFNDFKTDSNLSDEHRQLLNSDIRCTVLTNYQDEKVLYDIFHRLNSGSVPLNSQELRQVLNRGKFTKFLMSATDVDIPIRRVMNLDGPDSRLRDAEILLRFISFSNFGDNYRGSMNNFLSDSLKHGNRNWDSIEKQISQTTDEFHRSTEYLINTFPEGKVGRKFARGQWESRFNRALFEVECFYFRFLSDQEVNSNSRIFIDKYMSVLGSDEEFIDSIESTTKSLDKYKMRFEKFQSLFNDVFGKQIDELPVRSG